MVLSRKYNLVNNLTGWGVFIIALITYWLTLEPTASYWDCGEFIIQADKLEIGHPPGNPIFMLTARFFANFAFGDPTLVPLMVNAMSGLLSALTILLLFWTITHLVRRLTVSDSDTELTLSKYLVIMGSGVCGALAYTWSDTFWFSAVEGEVYAFSSFCTALVFWLILKWENRADEPHSDRYLILIAYVIGVSVAVHLLNLLCIPAIVLVYCYRKVPHMNVKKSLLALLIGFAIIVFVLYGLVPGFIEVAGWFEIFAVNTCHLPFNSGLIIYTLLTVGCFVWALIELYKNRSAGRIILSFSAAVLLSGILFIGSGIFLGVTLFIVMVTGLIWLFFKTGRFTVTPGLKILVNALAVITAAVVFLIMGGDASWGSRIFWLAVVLVDIIAFNFLVDARSANYKAAERLNVGSIRWLNITMWSMAVIFVGYSSYALILIRSNAHTPMNQNAPDNVFDLSSYLNREQYGDTPLLYGYTYDSQEQQYVSDGVDQYGIDAQNNEGFVTEKGKKLYAKGKHNAEVKGMSGYLSEAELENAENLAKRSGDFYAMYDYESKPVMVPELNILLPRIHSRVPSHKQAYSVWVPGLESESELVSVSAVDKTTGEPTELLGMEPEYNQNTQDYYYPAVIAHKPTFKQNMEFFFTYQLNHMYWRYFLWNFAGRQNDICNQMGELDAGNWISGFSFIDDSRLGDQSLLPPEYGRDNPGHNVFYMLPLLLGLLGLLWQAFRGKRGIEQFWVVFFLFFMTGIAIVLYLNQPPLQPRERDYAFAGSFYAFAIWIGMGVAAIYYIARHFLAGADKKKQPEAIAAEQSDIPAKALVSGRQNLTIAVVASLIGLIVPLQMVSQTWDDHDRSNRYAARDYAINYLNSLEPNAIVFCNGDNDTFPLWYAQEVEGVRPDVKIINLSYLNSEWYANQQRMQTYDAPPVKFTAAPEDYAYGALDYVYYHEDAAKLADQRVSLIQTLKEIYTDGSFDTERGFATSLKHINTFIPIDEETVRKRGLVPEGVTPLHEIPLQLRSMALGQLLMYDIIATNAANGWERPIYWACTVGTENYEQFLPYVRQTGMAFQLVPYEANRDTDTDLTYDIVKKYLWGGSDNYQEPPYFDETAGRMLYATRSSVIYIASQLTTEGAVFEQMGMKKQAAEKFKRAKESLLIYDKRLGDAVRPAEFNIVYMLADAWCHLGVETRDKQALEKGLQILQGALTRFKNNVNYALSLADRFGTYVDSQGYVQIDAQLTTENATILNTYYQLVVLYNAYDYSLHNDFVYLNPEQMLSLNISERTRAAVKKAGFSEKMLDRLCNYATPKSTDNSAADSAVGNYSPEELATMAEELAKMAEVVVELQGKSPEEYALTSEIERQTDSTFFITLNMFLSFGGTEEMLSGYENVSKVDMDRAYSMSEKFIEQHPELLEALSDSQQ
ncbi:MAG: DUF2723 domain-containing protein [Prevotella sp.]|nr:DUF2723 domain-containing protein [Prevotella sp.]MCM1074971.1 DUF2723 domain-containing protein [Ruminococcus sp.]